METTKDIVKIKLKTPGSIDPVLNNGKTQVEAGEEFFTTSAGYIGMLNFPPDQIPERIGDNISRDDIPATDAGGMTAQAITARVKKAAAEPA